MSGRVKTIVVLLFLLVAFVIGGTGDLQDKIAQEKLTAEIMEASSAWAVTR